jgi:hypothetical protein
MYYLVGDIMKKNLNYSTLPYSCKNCTYQKYRIIKIGKNKSKKIPKCALPYNKSCPGD